MDTTITLNQAQSRHTTLGPICDLVPDGCHNWYGFDLGNGRVGVATWLYEGDDAMRRTIIVREWNRADSPILVRAHVWLGFPCNRVTDELLDQLKGM